MAKGCGCKKKTAMELQVESEAARTTARREADARLARRQAVLAERRAG